MGKDNICARENRPCHLADEEGGCKLKEPPENLETRPTTPPEDGAVKVWWPWIGKMVQRGGQTESTYVDVVEKRTAEAYLEMMKNQIVDDREHISLLKEKLATLTKESLASEAEHMRKMYVATVERVEFKDRQITELTGKLETAMKYCRADGADGYCKSLDRIAELEADAEERKSINKKLMEDLNKAEAENERLNQYWFKKYEAEAARLTVPLGRISCPTCVNWNRERPCVRCKTTKFEFWEGYIKSSGKEEQIDVDAGIADEIGRGVHPVNPPPTAPAGGASSEDGERRTLHTHQGLPTGVPCPICSVIAEEREAKERALAEIRLDWGRREDDWEGRLAAEKARSKTFFDEGVKKAAKIAKLEAMLREITSPPKPEEQYGEFPSPDESTWPPNAKKSTRLSVFYNGVLGKIVSDGERGYICTHCGKVVTKAHHIKPESYAVVYEGQRFYMERHICDDCMKSYVKPSGWRDGPCTCESSPPGLVAQDGVHCAYCLGVVKPPAAASGDGKNAGEVGSGLRPHNDNPPQPPASCPAPAETAGDSMTPEERNIDAHAEEYETMAFLIRQYANGDEAHMTAGAIALKNHIIGILNGLGWSRTPTDTLAAAPSAGMILRRFVLNRYEDVSGVSGLGKVAGGVMFPDGTAALWWGGNAGSVSYWKGVEDILAVHGHEGRTTIEFLDSPSGGPIQDPFTEFLAAMREKFNRSLRKGANRSPTPWTTYNTNWLKGRLEDEWGEWRKSLGDKGHPKEGDPAELVDIANFCVFIWKRMMSGGKP